MRCVVQSLQVKQLAELDRNRLRRRIRAEDDKNAQEHEQRMGAYRNEESKTLEMHTRTAEEQGLAELAARKQKNKKDLELRNLVAKCVGAAHCCLSPSPQPPRRWTRNRAWVHWYGVFCYGGPC